MNENRSDWTDQASDRTPCSVRALKIVLVVAVVVGLIWVALYVSGLIS